MTQNYWNPPNEIKLSSEEKAKLIRDLVKPLRVCRNIMASYQTFTARTDLNREFMTGYEIGRLTRDGRKIADALDLLISCGESKFALYVYIYMKLKQIEVWRFNKSMSNVWMALNRIHEAILEGRYPNFSLDPQEIVRIVSMIHEMLDLPLSQSPGRFMLIKLSLK